MTNKLAICEFRLSPRCYIQKEVSITQFYRNRKKNGGKFKCKICAAYDNKTSPRRLIKSDDLFAKIDSELKAYLLGVIAGDGNIKNNTIRIVAHNNDIETLELFQHYISPQSKIRKYKNQNCSYISFSSARLVKDICNVMNILPGKKSDKISLPNLGDELIWHFIRGLVDTDGSISNLLTSKRTFPICSYASKSSKIKNQIKSICDKEHISYTEDRISIVWNGRNAIQFMNKIYQNSTIKLTRKFLLYEIALSWISQKGIPNRPRKIRKDKGIKHVRN